ncbi:MAG: phosphotransferase [Rhodospirillaceae bacterium]|jgi:N-acetylmuramate 1-kinase|nr:phosphotransferase [Rhodospirillaceae bacterium]MBT5244964.1 phosphotransferase [Rhodospirillaceae bacterium]MBT5562647.1 phosphotransferase [Rhodospirillaceae bacterium]MBT6243045.1 phosphotransferase [Rhodospirillaceae bacterium]MBT7136968.1 phosphotransferase [Rhodospirillaceae bacterium]
MTARRDTQIEDFLASQGWAEAARSHLAGDASFRRYERIVAGDRVAVLMDAPPPEEDTRPFIKIARHLNGLGYSAPEILATDEEAGLLLLEDLGDDTYTRVLEAGGDEQALYGRAVDVLIDLHSRPMDEAVPPGLPPYGNGRLLDEAFLAPQWTYPAFTGEGLSEDVRRAYGDIWLHLFSLVHNGPKTLVLRDYHVDNLLWLSKRDGIRACGLLDFQDAVVGHPAYDLMSLLEDARRDLGEGLKTAMMERYLAAFPDLDGDAFRTAFSILAAQRHAKVIGIFTRLCQRDGKPDYLVHIPRVWRLLEAALENPALGEMKDWFDTHMPAPMRVIPELPK